MNNAIDLSGSSEKDRSKRFAKQGIPKNSNDKILKTAALFIAVTAIIAVVAVLAIESAPPKPDLSSPRFQDNVPSQSEGGV